MAKNEPSSPEPETDGTLRTDGISPILTIQLGDIGGFSLEPELAAPVLWAIVERLEMYDKPRFANFGRRLINSLEGKDGK